MKTFYKSMKLAVGVFLMAVLAVSCLPEQQSMGEYHTIIVPKPA